jgi:nucleoside-diphosphate-sugar epimerase
MRDTCMNKKVIAVTGANGYIGRHVVDALIDRGVEVVAVDVVNEGINNRAKIINLDIFSRIKDIFRELGSPDVCLHLAWKDGFFHNSDAHMKYLSKHYEFLRRMQDGGVKQIAVMGSMHEIGYYQGAVDENTPCNPISMYGIAKDSLRRSLFLLAKKNDLVLQWLRGYYIYGDDKRNHSIFTHLLKAEEKGQEIFPFNSGKNRYDFIHIDVLARMITACVLQQKIIGIINCCTGHPINLAEKVEGFIRDQNLHIKLAYGAFPDRPYDSPAIWGDPTKIKKIIKISLLEALYNPES